MDLEKYRKQVKFKVEVPSGFTFSMRKPRLEAYDQLMQFAEDKGIDLENPKENILRKYPSELARILLPTSSIDPRIVVCRSDEEKKSEALELNEVDSSDQIMLLSEIMKKIGELGKKARKRREFRKEKSSS